MFWLIGILGRVHIWTPEYNCTLWSGELCLYAKDNNLLEQDGWKRFKKVEKRQRKLERLLNQTKLHSYHHRNIYKFGVLVPRTHQHAMELDRENGKIKWLDAESLELKQFHYYDIFIDRGKLSHPLTSYKKMLRELKHFELKQQETSWQAHKKDREFGKMLKAVVKNNRKCRKNHEWQIQHIYQVTLYTENRRYLGWGYKQLV